MTDKELGKAMDRARKKRNKRILAAQERCTRTITAAERAFQQELDSLLDHNHPVLNRQDG